MILNAKIKEILNDLATSSGESGFTDEHAEWVWEQILAAAPLQPVAVPDGWREKLVGLTVSMDVSTSEENAGDRIFGEVEEVMDDGDALVLLAVESSRNFAAPAAQGDAKPELIEEDNRFLNMLTHLVNDPTADNEKRLFAHINNWATAKAAS